MCNPISDLKEIIRSPYAWPGGYPKYIICDDGGAICPTCARDNYRAMLHSTKNQTRDGWQVRAAAINWEDEFLHCDHCGEQIECAYPSDEDKALYQFCTGGSYDPRGRK